MFHALRFGKARRWPACAWVMLVSIATLPTAFLLIPASLDGGWLDRSWIAGLQLASQRGVAVGAQPTFTFGPLGYLDDFRVPFLANQWLVGVAVGLVAHVTFLTLLAVLLGGLKRSALVWALVALPILVALPLVGGVENEAAFAALVLAFLAFKITDGRWAAAAAAALGAMLALLLVIRAQGLVISCGFLVVCFVWYSLFRKRKAAVTIGAAFAIALPVLLLLGGLTPQYWGTFLRATYELGAGYSAAMYVGAFSWSMVVAAAVLVAFFVLAIGNLYRRRPFGAWLILALIVIFSAFKDAFVRADPGRAQEFFAVVSVVAVLTLITEAWRWGERTARNVAHTALGVFVATGLLLALAGANLLTLDDLPARLNGYATAIRAVVDPANRLALQRDQQAQAIRHYSVLINALHLPRNASIDAMPWDVALFYADPNLTWSPRPVLQSYAGYTSWLDGLDAAYISGGHAPDYIVYRIETIDNRYAPFDEPGLLHALLAHYRVVRSLDSYSVLLERDDAPAGGTRSEGQVCAPLGSAITVPQLPGRWVFADVKSQPTLPGMLLELLWRPAGMTITLSTSAGTGTYRLITGVAPDGLYVSSFIGSSATIGSAFAGRSPVPIRSITLDAPRQLEWPNPICVDFTSEVPPR